MPMHVVELGRRRDWPGFRDACGEAGVRCWLSNRREEFTEAEKSALNDRLPGEDIMPYDAWDTPSDMVLVEGPKERIDKLPRSGYKVARGSEGWVF